MSFSNTENATAIVVVAADACYPIEYHAPGFLYPDGHIEVEYPFVTTDGVLGDPDDPNEIDILGYAIPPVSETDQLMPINREAMVGIQKAFLVQWGASSIVSDSQEQGFDYFTDAKGYTTEDRVALNALKIGETWTGDQHDHTVTRI